MIHRVLCFGGRDWADSVAVARILQHFHDNQAGEPWCIINGAARGADRLCGDWGKANGVCVLDVPAPWDYCKAQGMPLRVAGPMRNQWMIDFGLPTYAIGFPGGAGTANMQAKLAAHGITMWLAYRGAQ